MIIKNNEGDDKMSIPIIIIMLIILKIIAMIIVDRYTDRQIDRYITLHYRHFHKRWPDRELE